jgi:hypothetical protein
MAQQFRVLQSLWAMERRRADEAEWRSNCRAAFADA